MNIEKIKQGTSFVDFVKAQPSDRKIDNSDWNKCAVGDWLKEKADQYYNRLRCDFVRNFGDCIKLDRIYTDEELLNWYRAPYCTGNPTPSGGGFI